MLLVGAYDDGAVSFSLITTCRHVGRSYRFGAIAMMVMLSLVGLGMGKSLEGNEFVSEPVPPQLNPIPSSPQLGAEGGIFIAILAPAAALSCTHLIVPLDCV